MEFYMRLKERLIKLVKNPQMLPALITDRIYKYVYRNIYDLPLKCEGLLFPSEVVFLYKAVLASKKRGDVLDFGSYKGLSTCALSIAAKKTNRLVYSFEWFEGLPPHQI